MLHQPGQLTILCIMVAAITKRAQFPFSAWLPEAIAAPTPVSALVHSSTLVTAGVFILIRFYQPLSYSSWFNPMALVVGRITMLIAGARAIVEFDLKKIVALSTLSQLGVMVAALGLGQPNLAAFHMITHALFKALIFICSGILIDRHSHAQDIRSIGNVQAPIVKSAIAISNLSLIGAPFLSGYFSKDTIIEIAIYNPTNPTALILILLATGTTALYAMRNLVYTIAGSPVALPARPQPVPNNDYDIPCLILTFASVITGAALN